MIINFNEDQALKVFKILEREWTRKRGVFADIVLPQDRVLPPDDQREAANFLFFSALFMRGGVISEDPFRWLVALYERRPEYYDPVFLAEKRITAEQLKAAFIEITRLDNTTGQSYSWAKRNGKHSLTKIDEHTRAWIHNAHFFVNEFNGDILNVFAGARNFEEAFARIDRKNKEGQGGHGILGMRRKIFSLFTIWLQEKDIVPCFPTPIPVDFHALRVLWITDILQLHGLPPFEIKARHPVSYSGRVALQKREHMIDTVTRWSQDFLSTNRISHLIINPAIWTLSRDLCANHFQNKVADRGNLLKEPADLASGKIRWPNRYKDPCLVCPIEKYCCSVVPAAPYYVWGILMKLERVFCTREKPLTQTVLPGMGIETAHPVLDKLRRRTKR